jgi:hypothetical protein
VVTGSGAAMSRIVRIRWVWPACGTLGALAIGMAVSAAAAAERAAPERPVSVLLVYAEAKTLPGHQAQDEAFRKARQAGLPRGAFFHTEYLSATPASASAQLSLVEVLKDRYRARPIDLVVASTSVRLRFVLSHRAELFPDAPVLFMAVNQSAAADLDLRGNVTGTWQWFDWTATLDFALRLQPQTRRVAMVSGASSRDRSWLASAREQLARYGDRLEIHYLAASSLSDVLQEVARLPTDTVVLFGTLHQDGTGHDFVSAEVAARVAKAASVPVYGPIETYVGQGIVVVLTIADDGRGFDPAEARHGLGLISLDERARLVGGRLTIASQPQRGTTLRIAVPLSEVRDAPRDRAAR